MKSPEVLWTDKADSYRISPALYTTEESCMITLKFHYHTQEDFRYGKFVDQEPRLVGSSILEVSAVPFPPHWHLCIPFGHDILHFTCSACKRKLPWIYPVSDFWRLIPPAPSSFDSSEASSAISFVLLGNSFCPFWCRRSRLRSIFWKFDAGRDVFFPLPNELSRLFLTKLWSSSLHVPFPCFSSFSPQKPFPLGDKKQTRPLLLSGFRNAWSICEFTKNTVCWIQRSRTLKITKMSHLDLWWPSESHQVGTPSVAIKEVSSLRW